MSKNKSNVKIEALGFRRTTLIYKISIALAKELGTDLASRQIIESMVIHFNKEHLSHPLKLKGSDSIAYNVNRAVDWLEQANKQPWTHPFL